MEQAVVNAAGKYVPAERFLQIVATGRRWYIQLRVERVKFQRIVVRQSRRRAGTHITHSLRDVFALPRSIGEVGVASDIGGQTRGSSGNVPGDPVRHVIERFSGMHIAVVE